MSEIGIPLLSGPPSLIRGLPVNSSACRKCNKEFNVIFARSRKCQHCGYLYCTTCSDYQALMPRYETGGAHTAAVGHDVVHVCAFCAEVLQITAGGKNYLRSLPLSKLRMYANAYNIKIDHAVEKDDVIEAVMSARGPNACLSSENEKFYRKYSVPDRTSGGSARSRGIFSRSGENLATNNRFNTNMPPRPPSHSRPDFARPDLEPDLPSSIPEQQHNNHQHQQHPTHPHTRQSQPPPPPLPPRTNHPYHQPFSPPPNRPDSHWDSSPHVHHSSWSDPPQPDYYNYGTSSTHQYPHASPHPQPQADTYYPAPPNPPPTNTSTRPSPPHPQYENRPPDPQSPQPRRQSQQQSQSRPQSQRQSVPPTLDGLLSMDPTDIRSLSISSLKSLLLSNHVNVNATMVLEKSDLVERVLQLVENEKVMRERARQANEEEEAMFRERMREAEEESMREEDEDWERDGHEHRDQNDDHHYHAASAARQKQEDENAHSSSSSPHFHASTSPPRPTSASSRSPPRKPAYTERNGLCVVCQDEEANIAIVDCGHLALCRGCSDLVMTSSRECPLCRTRIVTEARLLRIFKS